MLPTGLIQQRLRLQSAVTVLDEASVVEAYKEAIVDLINIYELCVVVLNTVRI